VFATIKGKTNDGSKIWLQDKVLEGVAAATIDAINTNQTIS